MHKILYLSILISFTLLHGIETDNYQSISIDNLTLNRTAISLTKKERKMFPFSDKAFKWNTNDNKTNKWRPQGITEAFTKKKHFIIVSWYGRKEAGYNNRGSKISVVDITNKKLISYRHILLINKHNEAFMGMHAGGLVYLNGKLHVPDTRKGKKKIHVFLLNDIRKVPKKHKNTFYNYSYILKATEEYDVSIKPSFMSYDYNKNKILLGSFNNCIEKNDNPLGCMLNKKNRLSWYSVDIASKKSSSCYPYFNQMQGAVSIANPNSNNDILFVASSYGRENKSRLQVVNMNKGECYTKGIGMTNYRELLYPPGLEDMHISKDSKNIWMLTEFGSNEGINNNRIVFNTNVKKLLKGIAK